LATSAFGQGAKLSPFTQLLVADIEPYWTAANKGSYTLPVEMVSKYNLQLKEGRYMATGILKIEKGVNEAVLEGMGLTFRTRTTSLRTFTMPIDVLPVLVNVEGVRYIQIDEGVKKKLKEAILDTRTNEVHQGLGDLPQAYDGTGVVVGIIDGGFDPNHPAFRSTNGSKMRVIRYTNAGTNLETEADILAAGPDDIKGTHGTHVAGIAVGSNHLSPETERIGYAPGADVVFATYGGDNFESAVIDAITYIYTYAGSEGKPAVINMSLGTHIGPHDGKSLFDEACDEILAGSKGRVLVGAAGNEGSTPLHISYIFEQDPINSTFQTVVQFEETGYMGNGVVDIWGQEGKEFSVGVQVVSFEGETLYQSEDFVSSTVSGANEQAYYVDEDNGAGFQSACDPSFVNNSKPNIRLEVTNTLDNAYVILWVRGVDDNQTVHLWNHGQGSGARFTNIAPDESMIDGAIAGDVAVTVGEIGGTGKSLISVGAYTTRNEYTPLGGESRPINDFTALGELASFSSRGPSVDGRVKPDITAPGNVLISAGASFSREMNLQEGVVVDDADVNGTLYPYMAFEGTSMATPGIAGVVALMLQANSQLTFEQVRDLLQQSARADAFTGTLPAQGNNDWGRGKVDAYNAVLQAVGTVGISEKGAARSYAFNCYPNPVSETFTVEPKANGSSYIMSLSDATGRRIWNRSVSGTQEVDVQALPVGFYFLNIQQGSNRQYIKVQVVR